MSFFDPNLHPSRLFALGSMGHFALTLLLVASVVTLVLSRRHLPALRRSRAFMAGTAGVVLGLEVVSYALKLIYPCHPAFERLPLHLCASLKIAVTLLILFERYRALQYLSVLSIGCGVISFVNLNLQGESTGNFMFWHYVIGHAYLVLAPLFLFLVGEHRFELKVHLRMKLGLLVWSFSVFLLNWALDTNYMYTGPHNDTAVPLVPASMMVWPLNYVSYVLIALVMLNVTYGILRLCQAPAADGVEPLSSLEVSEAPAR
ncbi:MAG: YwaF family protein [Archangiaceae bacterium]|nr:YwaF family protein [Archangiaceae bacterium]